MRLYFDTNVYSFIAATNEAESVDRLLRSNGHTLCASELNLQEIYAIPDARIRQKELTTLVRVASNFSPKPESWLHAREARYEISRCRRHWLRPVAFRRQERYFLEAHTQSWEDARALRPPSKEVQAAYRTYRTDFEHGAAGELNRQKMLRQTHLKGICDLTLYRGGESAQRIADMNLDDPESVWRIDCLTVWFNAIVMRNPASRDYADWLDPYVVEGAFKDPSYVDFWLGDVCAVNVPRNRITALANHFQLYRKIDHGNCIDSLHASRLVDCDLFVTADKAFFDVTQLVTNHVGSGMGQPVLIDRSAPSAAQELRMLLSADWSPKRT